MISLAAKGTIVTNTHMEALYGSYQNTTRLYISHFHVPPPVFIWG